MHLSFVSLDPQIQSCKDFSINAFALYCDYQRKVLILTIMWYAGLAEKPEILKNKRIYVLKIEHQKKKSTIKVDILGFIFFHFGVLIEL